MSKNKKRKKKLQNRKPVTSYIAITKTYFDDFVKCAHKFMRLAGLEPSLFDKLSKRTKMRMMLIKHTPYKVIAQKDSKVPRIYIHNINMVLNDYVKKNHYGDPKFNITYLEYMTYGMTLIFFLRNYDEDDNILPDQIEILEKIKEPLLNCIDKLENDHHAVAICRFMNFILMYFSSPHYRYYCATEDGNVNLSKGCVDNIVTVFTIEPERRNLIVDGKAHVAYELGIYNFMLNQTIASPSLAQIPIQLLEEENSKTKNQIMNQIKTDFLIPVYVQSHVIHRMTQRMDTKDNFYRNLVFLISFIVPSIITATNGQRLIVAKDDSGKAVGYFPFTKYEDTVFLRSFIPLSSPITPEGSILFKELNLQMEDSKYIGLDKFSFYAKTDFDKIPHLKNALKKANMWHLTEIQPNDETTEKNNNQFLINLFSKIEQ